VEENGAGDFKSAEITEQLMDIFPELPEDCLKLFLALSYEQKVQFVQRLLSTYPKCQNDSTTAVSDDLSKISASLLSKPLQLDSFLAFRYGQQVQFIEQLLSMYPQRQKDAVATVPGNCSKISDPLSSKPPQWDLNRRRNTVSLF